MVIENGDLAGVQAEAQEFWCWRAGGSICGRESWGYWLGQQKAGFESVILGLDANFLPFFSPLLPPRKGAKNKNAGTCCFIFTQETD